ncbi:VRR-NUC domain-containing protein [Amycolatopsis alkalitolerans]|uniref:VRR-NUC domain-containing protein n=1 Tax=Amycolatopsis alkalitolerans TaxID=2547244 RepID=A0A5C4LSF8_9PSEU|nr:VRR-NUC domain-containing protein [Amycolatopsis alkalitolerans]
MQVEVRTAAAELGIRCFHPHESRRDMPGWPDLVLFGRGGLIFRELKSTAGRVSRDQQLVGAELARAGADWAVWRPKDWLDGRIHRELNQLARVNKITH